MMNAEFLLIHTSFRIIIDIKRFYAIMLREEEQ